MEMRLTVCLAFFVLAVSQYSVFGHSVQRRQAYEDPNSDDYFIADEASEDEAQNDGDNAAEPEKPEKPLAVILTEPTTFIIKPGMDLLLPCKVSPDNGTVAQWYVNQTLAFMGTMSLGAADRYVIANSKDLLIKNASVEDGGLFQCVIPQKVPASVTHTVLYPVPTKVTSITATNNGHVAEDTDVTLSCNVAGVPSPTVVWSVIKADNANQRLTEKDGEFSVVGNVHSLRIKRIRVDQEGQYLCYAFSKTTTDQSVITVKVNRKPRVHVPKTVVNSDIQVEAVLECSAHEKPLPHIRWYKDDILIEDSSTHFVVSTLGTHSNLTVTPTADEDFGTFTCEAENAYGKHNKSIELVQRPVVEAVDVNGTMFSWTVHSHQPVEMMELQLRDITGNGNWSTYSVPVPQGQGHKYEVTYVLDNSKLPAGKYEAFVKVKNSKTWGGSIDRTVVEIVEDIQPQFIQHASVFRTSGAHSIRSSSAIVTAILMYLLVRMI